MIVGEQQVAASSFPEDESLPPTGSAAPAIPGAGSGLSRERAERCPNSRVRGRVFRQGSPGTESLMPCPVLFSPEQNGGIPVKHGIIISCIFFLLLVQGVSALSVTVTPDRIQRGDEVTVAVQGLPDNSTFSLGIEGTFPVSPGADFSFDTRDLRLPFSLHDGSISATLQHTTENRLLVRKGDSRVELVGLSTNGVFTTRQTGSFPAGTYDVITIGGTAAPDASSVIASLTLQGRKTGPSDSEILFVADGITDGLVTIRVLVDGSVALTRTIPLGSSATPSPTATSVISSGGSGGGGPGTTAAVATTVTATATIAPGETVVEPTPSAEGSPVETLTPGDTTPAPTTPARTGSAPLLTVLLAAVALLLVASRRS